MKYDSYKVPDLRKICIEKGVLSTGTKKELINRLKLNDDNAEIKIDFNDSDNISSVKKGKIEAFFIQLNSSNLFYYFNSGVFYPLDIEENQIYKDENRRKDLFNNFPQHIILLKKPLNHFNDDEVLVEVVVNDLNINKINDTELYYIEDPIPVSRVKSITFKTAQLVKSFLASAKTFPDSYIPEELCKIESFRTEVMYADLSKISLMPNNNLSKWKAQLDKFDKIMGIFSFMKNSNIFTSDKDNHYQEYPNGYISLLSLLNNNIVPVDQKDLGLYKYILFPLEIEKSNVLRILFQEIIDVIYKDIEFDFNISKDIIESTINSELATFEERSDLKLILEMLVKLENHQISFKDILAVETVRKNYPILVLLFLTKFSNKSKQHTDKQAVRNIFISNEFNFNKSITEFILSVLGLYYGYKKMIKSDTNLKIIDKNFNFLAENQQSIKFKLESNLDRISIESIFEFCKFSEVQNNDYLYLEIKQFKPFNKNQIKNGNFEYSDNSFIICNTKITSIKRSNKMDNLLKLIDSTYPSYIENSSVLLQFVLHHGLINKSLILELIKNNSNRLNYDELIDLIEFDKRRNKFR